MVGEKQAVVKTTLVQDKVCKSCVRFRGTSDDEVTTSLYLQNDAFTKLGEPKQIIVQVSAK